MSMIKVPKNLRKHMSNVHELLERAKELLEDVPEMAQESDLDIETQVDCETISEDVIDQVQEAIDALYDNFLDTEV